MSKTTITLEPGDETAQVAIGCQLAEALEYRGIVYLNGELGAGKTTLARGVLRALGHDGAVKSPTYTLVEPYDFDRGRVYHFDLYRLGDPEELEFLGARDMFADEALMLVEWPVRGEGWLPAADVVITLSLIQPGRRLVLEAGSDHGVQALQRLAVSSREIP
ncbi:tRNA (adenosine(37)-N6)-threonylcarbamoyltransferase complex ATPase subunit type 1 TsaE [Kushneria indalinina]|uniref:tRNA threonylcarbamoyladenosine biosynthesis protein TsaE n=1 Tax=Kushneria indalinina DSM 14324 TaxID=1122140 RepID=A0A3D9DUU4_9GAMM|nr:tRNA (adenosine(37)-N6)-threonylcarbamoyltransferase complex ATPase subunit type 1 TsaE [Kushneria indalinina]REC94425.1 tRNA threonylcarbamoyladenosine biosynthesis protein TsaE [Kushneria indalinina DSM 14324]